MVIVGQAVNPVRFPAMRAEAAGAVRALADPEYQQRVWIRREFPTPKFYDDFTTNVHILYDDTSVLDAPEDCVGTVLHEDEVGGAQALAAALDPLIEDLDDEPDAVYLADPRWKAVVQAARDLLTVLEANGVPR